MKSANAYLIESSWFFVSIPHWPKVNLIPAPWKAKPHRGVCSFPMIPLTEGRL